MLMLRAAPAETEEQPDAKARRRVQDLESDDGRAATEACLGRVDYHEPTKTLSISGHQAAQELNAASAPSTSTTPSISIGAAVGIGIGGALTVLLLAAVCVFIWRRRRKLRACREAELAARPFMLISVEQNARRGQESPRRPEAPTSLPITLHPRSVPLHSSRWPQHGGSLAASLAGARALTAQTGLRPSTSENSIASTSAQSLALASNQSLASTLSQPLASMPQSSPAASRANPFTSQASSYTSAAGPKEARRALQARVAALERRIAAEEALLGADELLRCEDLQRHSNAGSRLQVAQNHGSLSGDGQRLRRSGMNRGAGSRREGAVGRDRSGRDDGSSRASLRADIAALRQELQDMGGRTSSSLPPEYYVAVA